MSGTVDLCGKSFRIAERVGALPLMRFAKVAKAGTDADEMAGLAAVYDLLGQVVDPDDWAAFEKHADASHADGDMLLEVVKQAFVVIAARPTGRSSGSPGGPRTIEPSSTVGSSSQDAAQVIEMFNQRGRGDLALLVRNRQESLTG